MDLKFLQDFLKEDEGCSVDALMLGFLSTKVSLTQKHVDKIEEKFGSVLKGFKENFTGIFKKEISLNEVEFQEFLESLKENKISIICSLDENYPESLRVLFDPPPVLFYQGDLEILNFEKKLLSVVGARNMVVYGEQMGRQILNSVVKTGVITVSGLAYGIDRLAHQISMENGGKTIGVIGSGLDQKSFYPKENWSLKQEILKDGGLVLSEYAPRVKATKFSFPKRNRIIAALSPTTFVVQANHKSGSLITARLANEIGKNVVTIPARINDAYFDGNLKLLQDGAIMVLNEGDILSVMGLQNAEKIQEKSLTEKNDSLNFNDEVEKSIYLSLQKESLTLDEMMQKTGFDFGVLSEKLLILELNGKIIQNGERWEII